MSKNTLILIDGHAVLFRAFYAYPPLNTSSGELVNAVYGFTSIVLNVVRELRPTHIALAFDLPDPTFRHEADASYKAQRPDTPQDLIDQEKRVREVVGALNIPIYTLSGYEADDVIGTISTRAVSEQVTQAISTEVIIVTGDKDAFQLVQDEAPNGAIRVYMPGRNKLPATIYDEDQVRQRFDGLHPLQIIDLKGLAGDSSDNIPGVKGIGEKTAIKLLQVFGTVENIYNYLERGVQALGKDVDSGQEIKIKKILTASVVKKLVDGKASAFLSKKLATIVRDVPIEFDMDRASIHDYDKQAILNLFAELNFTSLVSKLPNDKEEQSIQEALF